MAKKFEIFVSYRRKGGYDAAKLIYDRLRLEGYSVSFDIETMGGGNFDEELEQRVSDCTDFILILSPGVFDRFFDSEVDVGDDWLRREIAHAIRTEKNIVPLALEGFKYPKKMPEDVKDINRKNALDLSHKHFEATYARMKEAFLKSKPRWIVRHKKNVIYGLVGLFLFIVLGTSITVANKFKENREQAAAELAEIKRQMDSIENEKRVADSIRQAEDSLKKLEDTRVATKAPARNASTTQRSSGKTLHWEGSSDAVGNAIFRKLNGAGVQRTKCIGEGMIVKVNVPGNVCKSADAMGRISCSYTPKVDVTNCSGRQIKSLDASETFKVPMAQRSPAEAKEKLAQEIQKGSLNSVVTALRALR